MTHGEGDEARTAAVPEEAATERDDAENCGHDNQKPDQTPSEEEVGGPSGPEPTRFGDWERKGRCIDF